MKAAKSKQCFTLFYFEIMQHLILHLQSVAKFLDFLHHFYLNIILIGKYNIYYMRIFIMVCNTLKF